MTRTKPNCTARPSGTFTPWGEFAPGSDLLFYEGLHGCVVTDKVNLAQHADLKIGVVPVINLEWIQKLHRDRSARGYSTEAVTDTILRRMPDYINSSSRSSRRPTSISSACRRSTRPIPSSRAGFRRRTNRSSSSASRNPHGIDFPYLLSMIHGSFMSRANSIVIPGGKLDIAMQLILTPMILKLVERRRRAI